ncbi:hypothetical protein OVA24_08150 [Luteolibacter sp. SL250]|uniref:hypothetical protein n=1 Tax=Luteolibacter sp. SL250 TaxID=2995170 RepID=UPI00226D417C|nr:hypothetical protein [Luteolibacter sp. SL250]WAC21356.1 hypothetical protein OVA24_08150 [Luteolibacter sp. SL250]
MRPLRVLIIVALVAGLLGAGYFWAYKTSSMGWVASTKRPVLRIMGMNLDYNEENGRRFSAFFRPLIEREYRQSAPELVEGTFTGIGSSGGMHVSRPGKMGILIRFGPEHESILKELPQDSDVQVWYKRKSIPENPFSYHYQLTNLLIQQ